MPGQDRVSSRMGSIDGSISNLKGIKGKGLEVLAINPGCGDFVLSNGVGTDMAGFDGFCGNMGGIEGVVDKIGIRQAQILEFRASQTVENDMAGQDVAVFDLEVQERVGANPRCIYGTVGQLGGCDCLILKINLLKSVILDFP